MHKLLSTARAVAVTALLALLGTLLPRPAAAAPIPVDRLAGPDRAGTAVAVSTAGFARASAAVLVGDGSYTDALAAAGLAAALGGPVLPVARDHLPAAIAAELDRLGVTEAVIVGGPGAVGDDVAQQVAAGGATVRRVSGEDRYATAAAVADETGGGQEALLALGAHPEPSRAWPDALSAGALLAVDPTVPLLLTERDRLPAATAAAIEPLAGVTIIGGPASVSPRVEGSVAETGAATSRVAGSSRYGTAMAVGDVVLGRLAPTPRPLVVASGEGYADALTAAALAAAVDGLLLLVPGQDLEQAAGLAAWLGDRRDRFDRLVVVGGPSAVSDRVVEQLVAALGDRTEPGPGPTPPPPPPPPSEPTLVAPSLDPAVPYSTGAALEFLYSGENPVQTGVDPADIDPRRAALVAGRVLDVDGQPVADATVSILDRPELGQTRTRVDGAYDLAVNGGGSVVVDIAKDGYLPVQRQADLDWGEQHVVDDVVLTALDPAVTTVDLSGAQTAYQVAAGSVVTDHDGTRQAVVLVPPGTTAAMTLPDGSEQPLPAGALRVSEFTVGETGEAAMPGALPPSSAYTYAAEFSFDEAIAADATAVRFNQPVVAYLEDFLDVGPGAVVPVGSYDRTIGEWVAGDNGQTLAVVSATDGRADLDLDGDAVADPDLYAARGISDDERAVVGGRYPPGAVIWRVTFDHFTPWDCNYLLYRGVPDSDAPAPGQQEGESLEDGEDATDDDCRTEGSTIGCDDRSLGETLPLTGTPYTLTYSSDRVPGDANAYALDVPLTGPQVPALLDQVVVSVTVAGERQTATYPAEPNLVHRFAWDGFDRYGRTLSGTVRADVGITYRYAVTQQYQQLLAARDAAYLQAFGRTADEVRVGLAPNPWLSDGRVRLDRTQRYAVDLQRRDQARVVAAGGWTFDVHHAYDPFGRTVYLGDGTVQTADATDALEELEVLAVNEAGMFTSAAAAPDGSIVALDGEAGAALRVLPDGTVVPLLSGLDQARDVAVAGDGTVAISEAGAHRVLGVAPDGTVRTLAGDGSAGEFVPGAAATGTSFREPSHLAWGPDGSLFVADAGAIRRVATDGRATTALAHTVATGGLAVDGEGNVYLSDVEHGGMSRLDPTGEVHAVFDGGASVVAAAADGTLYTLLGVTHVARLGADRLPRTVAGGGVADGCTSPSGANALGTALCMPFDLTVTPDGRVVIADGNRLLAVEGVLPAYLEGITPIVSRDGTQAWLFDAAGRHVETRDAVTGATVRTFAYDERGRLVGIAEVGGRATSIVRDAEGRPEAIVAPGGDTTTLSVDDAGYLDLVVDPAGQSTTLGYGVGGLLTSLVEPSGATHTYTYGPLGHLETDTAPGGGTTVLAVDGGAIAHTDPEGRVTRYHTTSDDDGTVTRTVRQPDGTTTTFATAGDGRQVATRPDGTVVTMTPAPDPRFGIGVPYPARVDIRRPDGTTSVRTEQRSVSLTDPRDPFSLHTLTVTATVDGDVTTVTYDAATRTVTRTSPEGRVQRRTLDEHGRLASAQLDTLAPVTYGYDDRGRLAHIAHGDRSTTLTYDGASDRVATLTDATGATTTLTYDGAGEVRTVTTPEGHTRTFGRDPDGRVGTVTLPEGQVHTLAWSPTDRLAGYTSATGETYAFARDRTGLRTGATLPGGAAQTLIRDDGRLTAVTQNEADGAVSSSTMLDHVDGTPLLDAIVRTGGDGQTVDLAFTGGLLTGLAFDGAADAVFAYGWDAGGLLASISVDGSAPEPIAHDDDGLLVGWGPLVLDRSAAAGDVAAVTFGAFRFDLSHDALGAVTGRSLSAGATSVSETVTSRDPAGRVTGRTDVVAGERRDWTYTYDDDGRLLEVRRDTSLVEAYTWDGNAAMTARLGAGGAMVPVDRDDDDRVTAVGGAAVTYDADGNLATRGGDAFAWNGRGELTRATLADGTDVTYAYDGLGRRVARTQDGSSTQYLYGNPADVFQVTAVREADGTLVELFYDEEQRVVALRRGGVLHGVASDHVGTPLAILAADGSVTWQRETGAFGAVRSETGDRLGLPIGFAGGLEDPATGLVRFGVRDYDPQLAQWTGRDRALFSGGEANLYGYAAGDPVNRVDRQGLFSVEAGAGLGLYLGIKLAVTEDGFSFCWEGGVGIGAGVEADFFGGLDPDGRQGLVSEIGASLGPVGLSGKVETDFGEGGCPNVERGEIKGCLGPACGKYNNEGFGTSLSLADAVNEAAGVKAQAKTTYIACRAGTWA